MHSGNAFSSPVSSPYDLRDSMRLFKLAIIVGLGIVFGVAIYLSQSLFGSTSPRKLAANTVVESELPPHDAVVLENLHKAIPVSRHNQSADSKEESHDVESAHAAPSEKSQFSPEAHSPQMSSGDMASSSEEDASLQVRPDLPVTSSSAVVNPPSPAPSAVPASSGNPHVQFAMTDTNSNTPRTKTIVDR